MNIRKLNVRVRSCRQRQGALQHDRGLVEPGFELDDHLARVEMDRRRPQPIGLGRQRRHQRHRLPDRHAVTQRIDLRRRGQHHAGRVIAVENERPLDGALGEDHLACPDTPQLLTRSVGQFGQMVGQSLNRTDEIVVEIAERRRPGQHGHVASGGECLDAAFQPWPERGISQRTAAKLVLLIDQDHAALAVRSLKRGVDAGRARTDDQHITVRIGRGIMIGVNVGRRIAETCHAADRRFIKLLPEGARPRCWRQRQAEFSLPAIGRRFHEA